MDRCKDIEIWKDIEGYEGLYQVSSYGRIRSLDRRCFSTYGGKTLSGSCFRIGKQLKLTLRKGYYSCHLSKNNTRKRLSVHRLVALAFIPNPHNLPIINHKDENPKNNHFSNLEWCDHKYNNNYGCLKNRRKQIIIEIHKRLSKEVIQFDFNGNIIRKYESAREVRKITGYYVSNCCNRQSTAYGFIWRYAKGLKKKETIIKTGILQYSINGDYIRRYDNVSEASEITHISESYIRNVLGGFCDKAKGMIFKYELKNVTLKI